MKLVVKKPLASSKAYAWSVVGMLWLLCFLNYADRQVINVIFPVLEHDLHLSKFELGIIGSAFMWLYAGCSFFAGFFVDQFSRKRLILGGCLFWSLVTMSTGWCATLWQFVAVRALEGMGESVYFPASMSLLADYHGQKTRSTAISLHQSGVYLGTIVGSSLGAWLAQHYGWRSGFYFFGGVGMIVSVVLFFTLREAKRGAAEQKKISISKNENELFFAEDSLIGQTGPLGFRKTIRYLFQRPSSFFLMLAFAAANFVAMIFLTWMPTFLYEKFHLGLVFAGFSAVVFIQVTSLISGPCSGWLADQLSLRIKNGRIIIQIVSLLLGVIAIVALGKAPSFFSLMIAMIGFGLCKGGYDAGIFASLFDHVEKKVRGSAAGLMNTVGWIGGALGPIVVGAVSTYGHGSAMSCMSAAISWSAIGYIVAAGLLIGVIFLPENNHRLSQEIFKLK